MRQDFLDLNCTEILMDNMDSANLNEEIRQSLNQSYTLPGHHSPAFRFSNMFRAMTSSPLDGW